MTIFNLGMHRSTSARDTATKRARASIVSALCILVASPARASFLSGDALDTVADWVAMCVLIVVPVGALVVFWLVHMLPEKIAEKRHHPQKDAITTLCLLSLLFGGLLWPLAWLWAYTRPVGYRVAYGTDKHDDYFVDMGEKAKRGDLGGAEKSSTCGEELDMMASRGQLPPSLRRLREELDELRSGRARPRAASSKDGTG